MLEPCALPRNGAGERPCARDSANNALGHLARNDEAATVTAAPHRHSRRDRLPRSR